MQQVNLKRKNTVKIPLNGLTNKVKELNKVKENMSKYAKSKFKTKEHGQNPIEWLNFLAKDEINTDTESQSHKTTS